MLREYATSNELGNLDELDEYGRRRRRPMQSVRRIPFDYVATFTLTGQPGRRNQSLMNTSAEGDFICTSIGYGAEEPKIYQTYLDKIQNIRDQKIRKLIEAFDDPANREPAPPVVVGGRIRVPVPRDEVIRDRINTEIIQQQLPGEQAIRSVIENFRDALSFKYAIIDKGSGRELQNAPIHNLAGLGRLDGTRPFRELPVPYIFRANSTILVEITELVTLEDAIIHIDFQGYKEFR